ncbi:MAG TPA: cation diffusion facilitator family transporter [Edaphocola sp.]|jgi:cobalt-zinc-cadmium efflux system protein|nr:cation diffusion facilitator family transporter [Edaphocola sp.]
MQSSSAAFQNKGKLKLVLGLTSIYLLAEVFGGIFTHSLALLADAGHMLTDIGGLAFALIAIHMAQRSPTKQRTYGYYRAEILAATANAIVLFFISFYILYEAWERFKDPPKVAGKEMMIIAVIGLVVNLAGMFILHSGSKESLNMKGAYFEVLSDMLTSLGVIAAGVIMLTTGWYYADPILSAAIGLFILPRTWNLLKNAVGILLQGVPADVNVADLESAITRLPGVINIHDLHVWTLTSGINILTTHVIIDDVANYRSMLNRISEMVYRDFEISHATIQLEGKDNEKKELPF